ncbi:MAG TPA: ABC transporter ATP-binding protein, partial [Leptospiraceae bacterium]|nr:ABC transporter ATP-binding protein [Leptospiraceae bacterium]
SFGTGESRATVVQNIHLSVRAGETVLISGPSGSGKTTLLTMLGCMARPDGGEIQIQNVNVNSLSQAGLTSFRLRHIGFIFQAFRLIPSLTAIENVQLTMNLAGLHSGSRKACMLLLEELGIAAKADKKSEVLSGGEKQRVAIARAIALNPGLILADEPTGSLDGASGKAATAALVKTAKEKGAGLIIVSHDPRIELFADRTLHMEDGRITEESRRTPTSA